MNFLFWAITIGETVIAVYFYSETIRVHRNFIEPSWKEYLEFLFPAAILSATVISSLTARLYFRAEKVSFYIAISPILWIVFFGVIALLVMIFSKEPWR